MTPKQFKKWRRINGFKSQAEAAKALGVSRDTIVNYENGVRRDNPSKTVEIPKSIELACAALQVGITEYTEA
ncbi:helix-turn-helix domain-containing protein [Flexibacterium corallicola]|uniref:helix-turn-helix domain-containing protein n=1 Tax=Flexibacterium corallicola TaxID=3037259 RepID=UPI00286F7195|nr:helix-turn-helix transcriptional regulator [Pseudovibrio sp. M1P-2-3]